MNTQLISRSLISAALTASSIVLLASAPAQAAPTSQERAEFNQAIVLKEAGWTAPAIEDFSKVRREAIARAEMQKAAKRDAALAKAQDATVRN